MAIDERVLMNNPISWNNNAAIEIPKIRIPISARLGRVRISTLHNETEKISLLNSNTYKGAFLCLVTYSHLPSQVMYRKFTQHIDQIAHEKP